MCLLAPIGAPQPGGTRPHADQRIGEARERRCMGLNAWLSARSLRGQAVIGGGVVALVTFVLNYSSGPVAALGAALVTGVVVGGAYYLGLRAASR